MTFVHCNSISLSRIFGSKIQDFIPDFFKNYNFFFQTQGYQRGEQYRSFKKREQSFINDALQMYRRDLIRFDQQEKHFTCKALDVTFKKNFLPFSPDFTSIFQPFPGLENCWANITIFKEFKTLYKPYLSSFKIRLKKYIINSCKSRRFE